MTTSPEHSPPVGNDSWTHLMQLNKIKHRNTRVNKIITSLATNSKNDISGISDDEIIHIHQPKEQVWQSNSKKTLKVLLINLLLEVKKVSDLHNINGNSNYIIKYLTYGQYKCRLNSSCFHLISNGTILSSCSENKLILEIHVSWVLNDAQVDYGKLTTLNVQDHNFQSI